MEYTYNNNPISVLTIPLVQQDIFLLLQEELTRKIKVSKNISIVSTFKGFNCMYLKQLEYNNIQFYQTDIANVHNTLKRVNTKYVLVINAPAIIVGDLDGDFINRFLKLDTNFVFGGNIIETHRHIFLGSQEFMANGTSKNIDSSICFGYTGYVTDFYSNYTDLQIDAHPYIRVNLSVESTLIKYYPDTMWSKIDSGNTLFYSTNLIYTQIREAKDNRYIYETDIGSVNRRMF